MYFTALFDGEVIDVRELRLESFTAGFFFGCGLFETLLLERGQPQFLERHLRRMRRSLAALPSIQAPRPDLLDAAGMRTRVGEALARCSEAHACTPAIAKITTSDGHVLVTFRDLSAQHTSLLRTGGAIEEIEKRSYRSGDSYVNHKTLSYLKQYSAMGGNLLFANERGELCESPTANVFASFEDRIVTPPLAAPCLPGILREVLLERGSLDGRPMVEEPLPIDALAHARGCILTSSVVIALPIVRFLGQELPDSQPLSAHARELVQGMSGVDRESPSHS